MRTPLIAWTEEMSVGVELLDTDHKRLIALLNDLHDGSAAGHGTERLGKVLDGLVDYTGTHFEHEEELFARTGYPDAAEHIQEHQALTRMVLDIQGRYNRGLFDALSMNTLDLLKNWPDDHVLGCDKKYKDHRNAKGIH